ncbi:MAG: LacI family DNA-binding transcriptional regulator [Gammaproteobacteria bacterium]|nr:LacI family DNA-binding transcriptional regulator [Gammaproteobacteria bacterium]
MEDVAQAAGVSRMTVSRALRKDGTVSEQTRKRILDLVSKMNYVPDQMAGSLSTKKSGFVATLVPSLNNVHYAKMVQALTECIESTGMQILLGHTDYSMAREEQLVESMLKRRPEAIALPFDGHTKRTIKLLKQAGIPVLELWETPSKPIGHTVGFSNEEASFSMTKQLIELGYTNIAFLCETNDEWTRGAARRTGFRLAMEEAGLSAHRLIRYGSPPMSIKDGYHIGKNLDQYASDTDCIFCVSDSPAFGVLTALQEKGIKVPDKVGIAGFGNFEVSRYSTPSITTVKVDPAELGRQAAELVIQLLNDGSGKKSVKKKIEMNVSIELRNSTRQN